MFSAKNFSGIYIFYLFWTGCVMQSDNLSHELQTFQLMRFDMYNRGSYNTSHCMKELMTCFETVRGDVICTHKLKKYIDTVCGKMRAVCDDYYGGYEKNYAMQVWQDHCKTWEYRQDS